MMMTKEEEVMDFLNEKVFNPILESPTASGGTKIGVKYTIMRMKKLNAVGMVKFFWHAISGTDRSINFAERLKDEGHDRFEDMLEEFRVRFDGKWLRA